LVNSAREVGKVIFPLAQQCYINTSYLDAATIIGEEEAENGHWPYPIRSKYYKNNYRKPLQAGVIYPTIMLQCYHFPEITLRSKRSGQSLQQ
jgi:hypothetical protein